MSKTHREEQLVDTVVFGCAESSVCRSAITKATKVYREQNYSDYFRAGVFVRASLGVKTGAGIGGSHGAVD